MPRCLHGIYTNLNFWTPGQNTVKRSLDATTVEPFSYGQAGITPRKINICSWPTDNAAWAASVTFTLPRSAAGPRIYMGCFPLNRQESSRPRRSGIRNHMATMSRMYSVANSAIASSNP